MLKIYIHCCSRNAACKQWLGLEEAIQNAEVYFLYSISFSVPSKLDVNLNCSKFTRTFFFMCVIVYLKQRYIPYCSWNSVGESLLSMQSQNCKVKSKIIKSIADK